MRVVPELIIVHTQRAVRVSWLPIGRKNQLIERCSFFGAANAIHRIRLIDLHILCISRSGHANVKAWQRHDREKNADSAPIKIFGLAEASSAQVR